MSVRSDEFWEFRRRQQRAWRTVWTLALLICTAVALLVCLLASALAGAASMMVLVVLSQTVIKRWNRGRWLKRFPDLARIEVRWVRDPAPFALALAGMRRRRLRLSRQR